MTSEGTPHAGGADDVPANRDDRPAFDTSVAHQARIYDYWLGGKDNYAADRKAAEEAIAAYPGVVTGARANRQFLARVVRHLAADTGIRQFLDIGTGIPTANNTHEVAQAVEPGVVRVEEWRASELETRYQSAMWGGVGYKP